MPLLFSYGTLQREDVQLTTFGRRLDGHADELLGFEPGLFEVRDAGFVIASGKALHAIVRPTGRTEHRVAGTAFELSESELARADTYEPVGYQRVSTTLASGRQAWVYAAATEPGAAERLPLLDNIVWNALTGAQARFASGSGEVRRYARGFSPIVGFADPKRPDFDTLAEHCEPGERVYTDAWAGPVPDGWQLHFETTMFKMVWDRPAPTDEADGAVELKTEHAPQALTLAQLTNPGPFGIRTIELGDYFGFFAEEQLIALAGERFEVGSVREISGVCTHPDFQGRGLARRLMSRLIRREMDRGELPCLHVVRQNMRAHELYERMGFRDYRESPVRVISRGKG